MGILRALKYPLWLAELATGAKAFSDNPLIGSPRLNAKGLHLRRVALADRMAARRRHAMRNLISEADRAAFDRDGFVAIENFLPADDYKRLKDEILSNRFPAREMRQGNAVTRRIGLDNPDLRRFPGTARLIRDPRYQSLNRYAGSYDTAPANAIQTIITDPAQGNPDPQTALHADTFHSTSKSWFFLQDISDEDGPFQFVPGSHRLTERRRQWEYEQSLAAAGSAVRYHARGSFRIRPEELGELELPQPVAIAVPENTLVVADTHGFHSRVHSLKPTTRVEIYATLRRNPFLPWAGFSLLSLPGISGHQSRLYHAILDMTEKLGGKPSPLQKVGDLNPFDPAKR